MKRYIITYILGKLFGGSGGGGRRRGWNPFPISLVVLGACLYFWHSGQLDLLTPLKEKVTTFFSPVSSAKPKDEVSFEFSPGLPKTNIADIEILQRKGYISAYSKSLLQPCWVAWRLTDGHVKGNVSRDGLEFTEDASVKEPRADTYDYIQSGFDRGHMCPAADNKWSSQAMKESFLMTNICPQHPELNRGDWNDIEQQCRIWAVQYGKVYIVCGPVFLRGKHKKIVWTEIGNSLYKDSTVLHLLEKETNEN